MLGVFVSPGEWGIAGEFFELFKTAWEPAQPGRRYRAVLSTAGLPEGVDAECVLVYGSSPNQLDADSGVHADVHPTHRTTTWAGAVMPLYRPSCTFTGGKRSVCIEGDGLAYRFAWEGARGHRIGYDLLEEVRHLLTEGQPAEFASVPTLDLHVDALRSTLRTLQIPFVELAARPAGSPFICCLTHDIDFAGLRLHRLDRTVAGFAVRGTVGTLASVVSGRTTHAEALRNLKAVLSYPLVVAGVARDPWQPFADYERADGSRPSTFFIVPRRDDPGAGTGPGVEPARAVRYQASDVAGDLQRVSDGGREVALHGIDAWRDADRARQERREVAGASRGPVAGVRMHWLYFDREAPARLEAAGFDYDSTWGYNGEVGYRAGTSQAFLPPGNRHLLELPLHIMDTALFYPDRLALDTAQGLARCQPILRHAARSGGAVVINWHDRSLAPERQWNRAYTSLLDSLDAQSPLYATARDAVGWFRWRRSVSFDSTADGSIRLTSTTLTPGLPGGTIVVHRGPDQPPDERHIAATDVQVVAL